MRRVVVATCPLGIVIYRYGRLTPKAWPGVLLGIDSLSTGGKMAPLKVELSMLRGMAGRYGQCADAVADLDTNQRLASQADEIVGRLTDVDVDVEFKWPWER